MISLEMYKSYQIQLVLVHVQSVYVVLFAYWDWITDISFLIMRSDAFGVGEVNYFNVIPWFPVIQFYVFIVLKAVSMLNFIRCNVWFQDNNIF